MPWNYPRFLDYAAEQILLRKVGGGYIFIHRFLLEYFANLEAKPSTDVPVEGGQETRLLDIAPSTSEKSAKADEYMDVATALLTPAPVLSEVLRLLPCGHEQRAPTAHFCSVCGAPIPP